MSKDTLINVPAFQGCPSACLISVIQVLQPKIGLPYEQLLFIGDIGECFYIIEHGRAVMTIPSESRYVPASAPVPVPVPMPADGATGVVGCDLVC